MATTAFRTAGGSVSAHGRAQAKSKGDTMPGTDGKFPIRNLSDLANAKHDIGRTNEPRGKVVSWIDSQARKLGGSPVGESPGGYVPNPQMDKPHMHALSMAAATHLHRAGHITGQQASAIQAKSRARMSQLAGAPQQAQAAPPAFGSLAPPAPSGQAFGQSNGYV